MSRNGFDTAFPAGYNQNSMIGKTLSHYEILEKLGEGGMGVVYRARDTKLDREVAIKLLPSHLSSDPKAVKRFVHEAKAASALNHSSIGVIHEIDETGDGQTFIVMALYEGGTLKDKIESGTMTRDEAVTIASQIASGLARVHEKGIVHRDLKPQNILLTRDGEAKIIDFGLAKLAGRTKLTREGSTLGTAAYMSPEQARGDDVDHRSDIFSFGTILYEMFTGEHPFREDHEAALLYRVVHEEPEAIRDKCTDLPNELCDVIVKALKKDPNDRYQSVAEMADDLQALARSQSSGSGLRHERPKGAGAGRRIAAIVGIAVIVIIAALVLKTRFGTKTVHADGLALAVIEFRDLSGSENDHLAKSLTSLINKGMIEPCPIRVVSEEMVQYSRRKVFGESEEPIGAHEALEIAERSKAAYFISGEVNEIEGQRFATWSLVEVGTGDNVTGGTSRGENLFMIADDIKDKSLGALADLVGSPQAAAVKSVTEVTTSVPEAYDAYIAGITAWENYSHDDALTHLERAVELDSTFALAYLQMSKILFDTGARGGAVDDYADLAMRYKSRVSPKDRLRIEIWKTLYGGGTTYIGMNEINSSYEQILEFWPDDLATHRETAGINFYEWYFADAVRFAERGLEYFPDDLQLRQYLGVSLFASGQTSRALHELRVNSRLFPDNKNAWDNLGLIYLASAMRDSAEYAFNKALAMDAEFYPSHLGLAATAYCRGDLESAIDKANRLLEEVDLLPSSKRHVLADMRVMGLAFFYVEAGQIEEALDTFEEARQYATTFRENTRLERERVVLLRRLDRGEELLELSRMTSSHMEDSLYATAAGLAQRAFGLAELDSIDALSNVVEELYGWVDYSGGYLEVIITLLEARIDTGKGDFAGAIDRLSHLRRSRLGYCAGLALHVMDEIARLQEESGDVAGAIAQHEEILRIFGGHALSHYGLGRLYEKTGRSGEAKQHYERFLDMWKHADEGLPQPEYARQRLDELKAI